MTKDKPTYIHLKSLRPRVEKYAKAKEVTVSAAIRLMCGHFLDRYEANLKPQN